MVSEAYASPNIKDFYHLNAVLRECLADAPSGIRRAALSLPDGVFRVQTMEFEELPGTAEDRERLIRWRLEKGAAFDIAETALRYQILGRQDKGFTLLSCVAKQAVIAQYESLLIGLGLEPWTIGPSSFHALELLFLVPHEKIRGFRAGPPLRGYFCDDYFGMRTGYSSTVTRM